MSDYILVEGLEIHAFHGVGPEEQALGQRFLIDLKVTTELQAAGQTDDYKRTLCYDALIKTATAAFTAQRFHLIEAGAETMAQAILDRFPRAKVVEIEVRKPFAPIAASFRQVGVRIVRSRAVPSHD